MPFARIRFTFGVCFIYKRDQKDLVRCRSTEYVTREKNGTYCQPVLSFYEQQIIASAMKNQWHIRMQQVYTGYPNQKLCLNHPQK